MKARASAGAGAQLGKVGAAGEGPIAGPGQHDDAQLRILGQGAGLARQRRQQRRVQTVDPRLVVHHQPRDAPALGSVPRLHPHP